MDDQIGDRKCSAHMLNVSLGHGLHVTLPSLCISKAGLGELLNVQCGGLGQMVNAQGNGQQLIQPSHGGGAGLEEVAPDEQSIITMYPNPDMIT